MSENQNVNLTVGFRRRPPRKHPVWDLIVICFGCALIATPFGGAGETVFSILFPICVVVYLLDCLQRRRSRFTASPPPPPHSASHWGRM
jgi:hypothetical protein